MSRVLGVIPSRLASTRLPRKPLHPVAGVPLLARVWNCAQSMEVIDHLVVATDSTEIAELCYRIGAEVVMTSPDHPSGTDRVHEASKAVQGDFDVIVNIQGDEPLLKGDHVEAAAGLVLDGWDVGTCATPVESYDEFINPSVVKVVRSATGKALYFSRAPIPFRRDAGLPASGETNRVPGFNALRHVGLYAYGPKALDRWVSLPTSMLEGEERLEQLRALEAGIEIGVAVVDSAHNGVDTLADVRRTEEILNERGPGSERPVPDDTEQRGSA